MSYADERPARRVMAACLTRLKHHAENANRSWISVADVDAVLTELHEARVRELEEAERLALERERAVLDGFDDVPDDDEPFDPALDPPGIHPKVEERLSALESSVENLEERVFDWNT